VPAPPHFPEPGAAKKEEGPYREAAEAAPESVGEQAPPSIDGTDVEWVGGAARPLKTVDGAEVKAAPPVDAEVARLLMARAANEAPRQRARVRPELVAIFAVASIGLHFLLGRSARYLIGPALFVWVAYEMWKAWRQSGRDLDG
jgi:hypothetical protein